MAATPRDDPTVPSRNGYTEFETDDGATLFWRNCEISGCPNCVCIRMSPSLCYVHGIAFGAFTVEEFEQDRRSHL